MIDYKKAPYIELEDYKAPKGINSNYIIMPDGKKIRLIYWRNLSKDKINRGTILLQQGHNEFIEKYYETIQELLERNFNVVAFDWRGQGLSDRMIKGKKKQYIKDFEIHDDDLNYIINEVIKDNFSKPLIAIAHSMGGCILLSSLFKNPDTFDGMILSAPMLGFRNEHLLMSLIPIFKFFFKKTSYFPLSRPNMGIESPFLNNGLTTDPYRYKRTQRLVRKKPEIRLWGVTIGWVNAVKKRLSYLRKKSLKNEIQTEILIFNSINDKVVNPNNTITIGRKFKNCEVINLPEVEHEIFMEKGIHRKHMWIKIDNFFKKLNI